MLSTTSGKVLASRNKVGRRKGTHKGGFRDFFDERLPLEFEDGRLRLVARVGRSVPRDIGFNGEGSMVLRGRPVMHVGLDLS